MEANTISALIEVVSRTTLSTLLPATIALAHEQLVAIELDQQRLQRTAVLMQRKGVYQTAAAKAFVELAMKVAKQLEAPGCSARLM
ncbi:HTH-type transcriptional regulator CynR [compost metagenome]